MVKPKILIIAGPTATGKSALAIEVGRLFGAEIISADAMQVYRYMDIGTDKPSLEQRKLVTHHLIDVRYPDEEFSAALFREEAQRTIANIQERGKKPVVVGGTGLYIKVLVSGLINGGAVDNTTRDRLRRVMLTEGREHLYQRLNEIDPVTAATLHVNDAYRIIRALEYYETTGRPISTVRRRHAFGEDHYQMLMVGLIQQRGALYRRIDRRVDEMMARGFLEEVEGLLDMGYSPSLKPMQSIGYKQIAAHLLHRCDLSEAVRGTKRDTRRYAKRQITWFKANPDIHWFAYPEEEDAIFGLIKRFWRN